jgi:glycosyltransferase involved in cell wall biosynthesis
MGHRVAYLTGEYLRISPFIFIYREIKALRRLGIAVDTYSIRGLRPGERASPEQREEMARTRLILPVRPWTVAAAHLRLLAVSPLRYLRALGCSVRMRQPGVKGLLLQVAYFLEAGVLAGILRRAGHTHLHNHLASSSASVACLAAILGGLTFSFTIHGTAIRDEPGRWRVDVKAAHASFIVCISEHGREKARELVAPQDRHKLHVVHCGIEPAEFPAAPVRPHGARLLFVGRIVQEKGIGVLLEAFAGLRRRHERAVLTIVGDGPDRARYEELSAELFPAEVVAFRGQEDPAQIKAILAASDLFVLPSFAEGIPVVLMEAMAAGLPVVATEIGGIPELVESGTNGVLVPPREVGVLREALDRLLSHPEERRLMGIECRRRVVESFDVDKEARRLAELLGDSISGSTRYGKPEILRIVDRAIQEAPDVEILKRGPDRLLARVRHAGRPVVLKLWKRQGPVQWVRALTRSGSASREWQALSRLQETGLSAPLPLGHCRIGWWSVPYTHALVMEDLGKCRTSFMVVKELAVANKKAQLLRIEGELIDLTVAMLAAGVVDPDHGLANVVRTPEGRMVRLDLEIARTDLAPASAPELTGRMIGRLVGSHAYAVQPHTHLTDDFAHRLVSRLPLEKRVLAHARAEIERRLRMLREGAGVEVRLNLDW